MRTRSILATLTVATAFTLPATPAHADTIRAKQWHLNFLRITEAHQISQGAGIVVAVPDTGTEPHPDLRDNLLPGKGVVDGSSPDGRRDPNSHGTRMAGLIAAHGQGNNGALGIAPQAKILPITTSAADSSGDTDNLAAGIEYAIRQGVNVINISATGGATYRFRQAIDAALAADIVVVAAAGNYPQDYVVGYPARHKGVIAVGGVDRQGNHAPISATGREVDVVAPATDLYSTSLGGRYRSATGTSGATAIVAGTVALIRSRYPHLSAQEVAHRLTATAIDKGAPGHDHLYGHGIIDPVAALTADVPPPAEPTPTARPTTQAPPTSLATNHDDDSPSTTPFVRIGCLAATGGAIAWLITTRRRRHTTTHQPNS